MKLQVNVSGLSMVVAEETPITSKLGRNAKGLVVSLLSKNKISQTSIKILYTYFAGVTNACALVLCSPGTFCRIDESTGEPVCEPSCDFNNGGCPLDQKCVLETLICLIPPCARTVRCIPNGGMCQCG